MRVVVSTFNMAKVFTVLKAVRNNWKKSVFFTAVLSYGVNYANEKYETHIYMSNCCRTVSAYGDMALPADRKPKRVTVILNPAANKRNAKSDFEKYCAPLLHLAGYSVTVLTTEREGGARSLVENLIGETDALIVAGGDGTLSEVVTGLLRRLKGDTSLTEHLPIGILPLGRTNNVARQLLQPQDNNLVHFLTSATMTIINEINFPHPVIKIENLESLNPEKCVYALNNIEWGAMRETKVTRDQYWYFGKFRDFAAFVFGSKLLSYSVDAVLEYSPPCSGCKNCFKKYSSAINKSSTLFSWISWAYLFKRNSVGKDYSKIINPECSNYSKMSIKTLNVNISLNAEQTPVLKIDVSPEHISYTEFLKEGYSKLTNEPSEIQNSTIKAKDVIVTPNNDHENKWMSIDNEDYEVKTMKLSLLPNAVYLFKPDGNSMNQNRSQIKSGQEPRLSLDKFNKHVGLKQFV